MADAAKKAPQKVHLRVAVEVNEKEWAEEYGLNVEEVAEDIKTYVQSALQDGTYAGQMLDVTFRVTG